MPAVMCVQRFVNGSVTVNVPTNAPSKIVRQQWRDKKKLSSSISSVTKDKVHNVSKHDAIKLRLALFDYRAELGTRTKECSLLTGLDITTGFSRSLIEDTVNSVAYIKDKEYLEENFAFFSDHVQKTWEIFNSVLLASDRRHKQHL